jgi:hypothetical protein
MNSVIANEQCVAVAVGHGARRRDDDATIECFESRLVRTSLVGTSFADISRRKHRHRQGNMNVQSNMNMQVTRTGHCGGTPIVRNLLTSCRQAICGRAAAIESVRYWSFPDRFVFSRNPARGQWRAAPRVFTAVGLVAASRMFVRRRESRWTVDLRMLRSSDNRLQTNVADVFLPNYWAKCLLIQQQLLALCVAEHRLAGAQWRPECPC